MHPVHRLCMVNSLVRWWGLVRGLCISNGLVRWRRMRVGIGGLVVTIKVDLITMDALWVRGL